MTPATAHVVERLDWMRAHRIWPALDRFFASSRSEDEYDLNAVTHVMGRASWFPGALLASG